MNPSARFGWAAITRIGLVQAAIGAVIVLMTSVLNRVMVVELGLAASVPGVLVGLHFAVQLVLRPQLGWRSDRSGQRTRWIAAGLLLLAVSGIGAAASTALMAGSRVAGMAAAVVSFGLVGAGASMAGTPLLALLSERVEEVRRPQAAAVVWLMMIGGFVVATVVASGLLEPFTFRRLVTAVATVATGAAAIGLLALVRLEGPPIVAAERAALPVSLGRAFRSVWNQPVARTFALFIFVSMLAYSAQDLILEPFGGLLFGLSPAESTRVSGTHQGGMLVGMLVAGALAAWTGGLRAWTVIGCAGSAAAFAALALAPSVGGLAAYRAVVPVLGIANGVFAVGAVGSMMTLSTTGGAGQAGIRMGVFGAAQAVASALGGSAGAAGSDLARFGLGSTAAGYAAVFGAEAVLFGAAGWLAVRSVPSAARRTFPVTAEFDPVEVVLG